MHHCVSSYERMVKHNSFEQRIETEIPRFDKNRKVTIPLDSFMNCTCGRTGKYLLPYPRIYREKESLIKISILNIYVSYKMAETI